MGKVTNIYIAGHVVHVRQYQTSCWEKKSMVGFGTRDDAGLDWSGPSGIGKQVIQVPHAQI